MSVEVISTTTGAALGAGQSVTYSYPTGRTAANYKPQGATLTGTSVTARQSTGDFSLIYGPLAIVVVYASGPSIPAGTVTLRCPVATDYETGVSATASGTSLGAAITDLVSLYGVTPIAQRAASAQAVVSATVGTAAVAAVGGAVVATGATDTGAFGYTEAQANAIVTNINTLRTDDLALVTRANELRADVLALTTLVNELRAALVVLGAIKGAA